ncbi:unnamed protein product, partial [Ectocarpus sp. 13 AM-2016]
MFHVFFFFDARRLTHSPSPSSWPNKKMGIINRFSAQQWHTKSNSLGEPRTHVQQNILARLSRHRGRTGKVQARCRTKHHNQHPLRAQQTNTAWEHSNADIFSTRKTDHEPAGPSQPTRSLDEGKSRARPPTLPNHNNTYDHKVPGHS